MYKVKEIKQHVSNMSPDQLKSCNNDFETYISLVNNLSSTTSKKYFYDGLNEWNHNVYNYVHDMLKKYGFVNGDIETNRKNPCAMFWWEIYQVVGNIIYSPFLKTESVPHHSSAFERNEALIKELYNIEIECVTNNN
jgi:hypothetical protein